MFERENANLSIVEYVFMKTNKNALSISHVFFPFFFTIVHDTISKRKRKRLKKKKKISIDEKYLWTDKLH